MKKLILFAALAIFVIANSNAQDINFGAKAGVNFASITGDDTDGFASRTSIHAGLVVEIVISETFSFQPEVLYSGQGATEDSGDGELNLDYINVPLMAKFYVAEGFSLEAGPQVGFLMSAEVDGEDIKDYVKGIDFGVNFGIGYKMEGGLNFGARYNLGLSNGNDDPEFPDDSLKNSVIQAYVGFFF